MPLQFGVVKMIYNLDTSILKTFVVVSETGSFSETAKRLLRTQPAISQQIKKLESITNHKLFRRQGNAILLTHEGEALLKYAKEIVNLSESARSFMAFQQPTQEIRLGAPDDYASYLLSESIIEFQAKNPAARVSISCGNSRDLVGHWEMGHLDLCVVSTELGVPLGRTLRHEELVWVSAEGWEPGNAPLPLAGFPKGCQVREAMENALDEIKKPWRIAFSSNSINAIRNNVVAFGSITAVERSLLPNGTQIVDASLGLPLLPAIRIALLERPTINLLQKELSEIIRRMKKMTFPEVSWTNGLNVLEWHAPAE
jgi:DNA-binding transcriptional LysR family regulator